MPNRQAGSVLGSFDMAVVLSFAAVQMGSQGKTEKYTERQWWFKVDWDDAEEEDGIDPWVNLKDAKALKTAFVGYKSNGQRHNPNGHALAGAVD